MDLLEIRRSIFVLRFDSMDVAIRLGSATIILIAGIGCLSAMRVTVEVLTGINSCLDRRMPSFPVTIIDKVSNIFDALMFRLEYRNKCDVCSENTLRIHVGTLHLNFLVLSKIMVEF